MQRLSPLLLITALGCAAQSEQTASLTPIADTPSADVPAPAAQFECDCTTPFLDDTRGQHSECLGRVGDSYQMRPEVLSTLPLGPDVTNFVAFSDCGTFWVRRDGRAMPTQNYDNSADYFEDGLARYVLEGKYGYMNQRLEIVVPATYDFAFPFQDGRGLVCFDCKSRPTGEHTFIECQRCGAVDATGKLIVPVKYTQYDLPDW